MPRGACWGGGVGFFNREVRQLAKARRKKGDAPASAAVAEQDDALLKAARTTAILPHVGEILGHLMALEGGTLNFARTLHDMLHSDVAAQRVKALDSIQQMLKLVTARMDAAESLGMLSDEDLDREALELRDRSA